MGKKVSKVVCVVALFFALSSFNAQKKTSREYYQLSIYHFQSAEQEKALDNYFQRALLPALHRLKVMRVGVFKSWSNDTVADKTMYLLIPFKSIQSWESLSDHLLQDEKYLSAASSFINPPYNIPVYQRVENILLKAFPLARELQVPVLKGPKNERVYELRSYQSPNQERFISKLKMFNAGNEIGLFARLGFNAAFYGEVLEGSKMPNLMYMTCFENKTDRETRWKNFGDDAYWKELSGKPEYANNVSHIDIVFLQTTDYSDF